ncbi:MAG: hypothetical protein IJU92_02585 [Spirochaetaceae bacterium]|nr:hypothetical protein [Spirochaetaceae bacterium]
MGILGIFRRAANFITFGAIDRHDAKKIRNRADRDLSDAKEELENKRIKTEKAIEDLGNAKFTAYTTSLEDFFNCYIKLSKADRKPFKRPTDTVSHKDIEHSLTTIQKTQVSLKQAVLQSASAVSGGALLAGGTYFAVKGIVFGNLAGVAAKNATLAWLGGGSLASGGAGMAGGMAVLGGIALAPIALFSMFMGYISGKQQLNEAENYADEVEVFVQKVKTLICELNHIERAANSFTKMIISLSAVLEFQNKKLNSVITRLENRTIFQKVIRDPVKKLFGRDIYEEEELNTITTSLNCAVLLSSIIEKPLMNDDGAFISDSIEFIESKNQEANKYKKLLTT